MGYLHIENLYKNKTIFLFKECYALEKIHGTSTHITWNCKDKTIRFFSGGERNDKFVALFNESFLKEKFIELYDNFSVTIYGEAYGGTQQAMAHTYGDKLKFIGFDVKINDMWMCVPKAEKICSKFNIEFVPYNKILTDITAIEFEKFRPSVQAERNGCGSDKMREGIVLRPLEECIMNGKRVISKYRRDEFRETATPRPVDIEEFKVLSEAEEIADEWVTELRLNHVLGKLPTDIDIKSTKIVIEAMVEDVYREAKEEIIESIEVTKAIGTRTSLLFRNKLKN